MSKVALITAGGSGMGADSARALAEAGYEIGILSSSGNGAEPDTQHLISRAPCLIW